MPIGTRRSVVSDMQAAKSGLGVSDAFYEPTQVDTMGLNHRSPTFRRTLSVVSGGVVSLLKHWGISTKTWIAVSVLNLWMCSAFLCWINLNSFFFLYFLLLAVEVAINKECYRIGKGKRKVKYSQGKENSIHIKSHDLLK